MSGHIDIISTGPGDIPWIPPAVSAAMEKADLFLGYKTYLEQISGMFPHIPREFSGMRQEKERAERAVTLARSGKHVAVISGGDAGVFGMAGLVIEIAAIGAESDALPEITVFPGISALNAAASLLGAPLMTDFAAISLSDYLIPLETILLRVENAVKAGFILCLYNPKSKVRSQPYNETLRILSENLPPETPVGIVQSAYRPDQKVWQLSLSALPEAEIEMNCILIVGNRTTRQIGRWMVTPRGYPIERGNA